MFIAGGTKDGSGVVSVLVVDALNIYDVIMMIIFIIILIIIIIIFQITIIRIVTIIMMRGHLERVSQDGRLALVSWILGSSLSSHLDIDNKDDGDDGDDADGDY